MKSLQYTDEPMRPDPVVTAIKALQTHYPEAIGGFLSGSVIHGNGTATSDLDIAVLFEDPFDEVHRFSTTLDDWPIEFFVHNVKAQDYYFEKDRLRGMCVLPTIVGSGLIIPAENELLRTRQETALAVIEAGPPVLSSAENELRRYLLTDLLDDLVGTSSDGERNAILSQLHNAAGDLYLRGQNQWSGAGKSLIRCLENADPEFAAEFVSVFSAAFSDRGSNKEIIELIDRVLAPYGGRLRDGFNASAPETWRHD